MDEKTRTIKLPDVLLKFVNSIFELDKLKAIFINHLVKTELGSLQTLVNAALYFALVEAEAKCDYNLLSNEYFLKGLLELVKPLDNDYRDCFDDKRSYYQTKIGLMVIDHGNIELFKKLTLESHTS